MSLLFGHEVTDANGNRYPEIYARCFDPTNPAPLFQQVNQQMGTLWIDPFHSVHPAAYYDKRLLGSSSGFHQDMNKIVMKKVDEYAKMAGHENDYDVVFVWNIDDITLIAKKHIDELAILRPDINSRPISRLQEDILNKSLFNDLEESELHKMIFSVDNIEDAVVCDDKYDIKKASVYNALRNIYNNVQYNDGKNDLLNKLELLDQKDELCETINQHQQIYNQRWKYAKKCLKLTNRRSAKSKTKKFANVVLCDEGVASGAAQLLISGLSSEIPIENIYSTCLSPQIQNSWWKVKFAVDRLQQKFGKTCCLVHVTSGVYYRNLPITTWTIRANEAFKFLYNFQRDLLK